jgi:hypothetical protein
MFLIKCKDETVGVWLNGVADDFLRFLPNHFNCESCDLDIRFVDPKDEVHLKSVSFDMYISLKEGVADLFKKGKDGEKDSLVASVPVKKLMCWPYDKDGNFLGNRTKE